MWMLVDRERLDPEVKRFRHNYKVRFDSRPISRQNRPWILPRLIFLAKKDPWGRSACRPRHLAAISKSTDWMCHGMCHGRTWDIGRRGNTWRLLYFKFVRCTLYSFFFCSLIRIWGLWSSYTPRGLHPKSPPWKPTPPLGYRMTADVNPLLLLFS